MRTRVPSKWVASGAIAVVALLGGVGIAAHFQRTEAPALAREPLIDWCAPGLVPIAGGGCFAAAPFVGETKLLVYLHGRYAATPAGVDEELGRQARVAALATKGGYSVLALRGQTGECPTVGGTAYYCWPSNDTTKAAGPAYVAGWSKSLAEVDRRVGHGKRFLLGFSNGGWFASLVVSRELMPFTAVAIAGAGTVEPIHSRAVEPPLLLLTADGDPSITSTMRFADALAREQWPYAIVTRDGEHGLVDSDVEIALVFFDRAPRERFPLAPPLSTRLPRPTPASGLLVAAYVPVAPDDDVDAAAPSLTDPMSE